APVAVNLGVVLGDGARAQGALPCGRAGLLARFEQTRVGENFGETCSMLNQMPMQCFEPRPPARYQVEGGELRKQFVRPQSHIMIEPARKRTKLRHEVFGLPDQDRNSAYARIASCAALTLEPGTGRLQGALTAGAPSEFVQGHGGVLV